MLASHRSEDAKGQTRADLFVAVLFSPFRAQMSPLLLAGVGQFLCAFVLVGALVVALDMGAVTHPDI